MKRLFANVTSAPQISKSIPFEDLRIEYNANNAARKWRVPVPPEVRSRLPIDGGYDRCGWVYSYLGVPGVDYTTIVINRIEGHRCASLIALRFETV